jgi:hypothetical protein
VPIRVQSGDPAFDTLPAAVAEWFEAAAVTLALGDETVRGYRGGRASTVSLREHARALSSGVYLHGDVTSALDVFFRAPLPDGSLFDTFAALPDDAQPAPSPLHFDDLIRRLRLCRQLLHADSESFAVRAAFRVWQATGNTLWLQAHLPVLSRALSHLWRHPHRWSNELDLPKRAFTLDAWPFEFCAAAEQAESSTRLGAHTKWCVHPGDAAQLHAACRDLALMHAAVGNDSDAAQWRERAEHLEAQVNSVGWNGQFYMHQIHLSPVRVRGVDEARQLAACNCLRDERRSCQSRAVRRHSQGIRTPPRVVAGKFIQRVVECATALSRSGFWNRARQRCLTADYGLLSAASWPGGFAAWL